MRQVKPGCFGASHWIPHLMLSSDRTTPVTLVLHICVVRDHVLINL